jgi:hypothetical protein
MKVAREKKLAIVRDNPVLDNTYVEWFGGVACRAVEYDDDRVVKLSVAELTREFFCDSPSLNIMKVVIKNLPSAVVSSFSVYIVDVVSIAMMSSSNAMPRCYYCKARSCHGQEMDAKWMGVYKEISAEACLQQLDPTGRHVKFAEICERSMRAGVNLTLCRPFLSSSDMETFVNALNRKEIMLTLKCRCLTDGAGVHALLCFMTRGLLNEGGMESTEVAEGASTLEAAVNERSVEECEEYTVKILSHSVLSTAFWNVDDLGHGQASGVLISEICSLIERDRKKASTGSLVACFIYPHPYSDTMKEICKGIIHGVADLKIVTSRNGTDQGLFNYVVVLDIFGDFGCTKNLALELSRVSTFIDSERTRAILVGGKQIPIALSWPKDFASMNVRRAWQKQSFIGAVLSTANCLSLGYNGDAVAFPGCAEFHSGKTRDVVCGLLVQKKVDQGHCSWTTRSLTSHDKKRKFARWDEGVCLDCIKHQKYPRCLSDTEYVCRKGQSALLPNGDSVYFDTAPVFCETSKRRVFSVKPAWCQDPQSYEIVASQSPPLCTVSLHYRAYHSKTVKAYKA